MHELLSLVFTYVWGAWRYRWLALVIAWVVALGGWVWVWQMPESYVATARVYVDTNTVLRPLLRGIAIQPDIDERITLMSRTLLSRPNLEKLMRMTDLDLEVNTDEEKEELLSELGESISLGGDAANTSLYYISVANEDRNTARRIAQALITVFIESSLGDKRTDSTSAQSFLDQQIADYEQRLIAAEARLAKFKQENVNLLPGDGADYYAALAAARGDLNRAKLQLREMENRQKELEKQLRDEGSAFMSTGTSTPIDYRIQSLQVRRDDLLTAYTEKHPEVRQITGLIEELEAEKAAQIEQYRDDPSAAPMGDTALYQGMRSILAEAEASVAELRVRVTEYQERVTELEEKVNDIPEIEAHMKQLNRDYEVVSRQHQMLLEKRESAQISEDMEHNASDVVFRVIDPPFVPSTPSEPNKLLLNGAVLFVALGIGAGIAVLLFLVSPVIGAPQMVVNATGLPLLGTVSLSQSREQRRREVYGLVTFSVLAVGLLLAYVTVSLGPTLLA